MDVIMEILMVIVGIIWLVAHFLVSIVTMFEAENESNIFKFSFYVQRRILSNLSYNEINKFGCVIALFVITAITLPSNIIMLALKILMVSCSAGWNLFKRVFRKREDGDV